MALNFRKAERRRAKARIGLSAPAGAGKTHGALLLAAGLSPDSKIAVFDTENSSAELEAGKAGIPPFDVAICAPPFDPRKAVAFLKEAAGAGYEVAIIDSLSHFWQGTGGALDMVDQITSQSNSKNAFNEGWRKVTPLHNALVDAILQSPLHVICTMRSNMEYTVEEDGRGRKTPKKVGLAPVVRKGMEYEFTLFFDIDQANHAATATKDRTSLWVDEIPVPLTAEHGRTLREWLDSGTEAPPAPEPEPAPETEAAEVAVAPRTATPPPPTPAAGRPGRKSDRQAELKRTVSGKVAGVFRSTAKGLYFLEIDGVRYSTPEIAVAQLAQAVMASEGSMALEVQGTTIVSSAIADESQPAGGAGDDHAADAASPA